MSAEKLVIDKSTLEDIGDAVREKEGSSELIPVTELKPRILAIRTGEDTSDATASAGDILVGCTAYVDGSKVTGTVPVNGNVSAELLAGESYTVPYGHHTGAGKITAKDLASQTSGTAGAGDIRDGKTAWIGGSQVTGEMPVNSPSNKELPWTITAMPQGDGNATIKVPVTAGYYEEGQYPSTALPMKFQSDITPGTSDITVSGGAYFPSGFKVKGDADLIAANIKKGVSIFNVVGELEANASKVFRGSYTHGTVGSGLSFEIHVGAPIPENYVFMLVRNVGSETGSVSAKMTLLAYADSGPDLTNFIIQNTGRPYIRNDVVDVDRVDNTICFMCMSEDTGLTFEWILVEVT